LSMTTRDFSERFEALRPRLLSFAIYGLGVTEDDAEDLVSSASVILLEQYQEVKDDDGLLNVSLTIIRNLNGDRIRSVKTEARAAQRLKEQADVEDPVSKWITEEDFINEINDKDDMTRQVLALRALGFKNTEISKMLEVSTDTVAEKLKRGREGMFSEGK